MKKVLYIGVASEHGGAARSMLEMVKTIRNTYDDIEPIVLCCHKRGHIDIYKKNGINAYPSLHAAFCFGREKSNLKFILKYFPRYLRYKIMNIYALKFIKKYINLDEIDLIHSNSTRSDIGMILSEKYGIPHVLHLREFGSKGTDYDVKYYRRQPIKYIDERTNHFIAITEKVKKHWVAVNGYKENKITVVYNGIDDSDIKVNNGVNNKRIKFVFTGFILESKGQERLLEELLLLDKSTLDRIQIDFIGSGEQSYVNKLKEFAEKNNLNAVVNFLGRREDVHQILCNYDVGLVCSRAEAFGRVTAEYMLAGLCVIASNTGANDELIDDNITGLLFDYYKPGALAKKLEFIVSNSDIIFNIGINARQKAKDNFVTEINAKNVVDVYRMIWEKTS